MLLGTLGASLWRNMLAGKGIVRAGYGNNHGKNILRTGYGCRSLIKKKIIPPHLLTNFEIQNYYEN